MPKLDIGCGGRGTRWPGFIGTDILPVPTNPTKPKQEYVQLDFVHDELPWKPGAFDEIIALHVIEHFPRPGGRKMIQRALWLLKPGCKLIVTCPDLRRLCCRYMDNDAAFFSWKHNRPGKPDAWPGHTIADKLNWIMHEYGHKWLYDDVALMCLAREAGCTKIKPLSQNSPWWTRRDHEFGYVLTATGTEQVCVTPGSAEAERRMAYWAGRERRGLKHG